MPCSTGTSINVSMGGSILSQDDLRGVYTKTLVTKLCVGRGKPGGAVPEIGGSSNKETSKETVGDCGEEVSLSQLTAPFLPAIGAPVDQT